MIKLREGTNHEMWLVQKLNVSKESMIFVPSAWHSVTMCTNWVVNVTWVTAQLDHNCEGWLSTVAVHTVSFLFKVSGLKKLAKWSRSIKVNVTINFWEKPLL